MGIEKDGEWLKPNRCDSARDVVVADTHCAMTTLPTAAWPCHDSDSVSRHRVIWFDASNRTALIERALDLQASPHFDTARLYSDGLSRRSVLGTLLSSRRASVTITTKFGLKPTP